MYSSATEDHNSNTIRAELNTEATGAKLENYQIPLIVSVPDLCLSFYVAGCKLQEHVSYI